MSLYAIADLHFGKGINKTMNLFGEPWIDHMDKLTANWNRVIGFDDTVLVPGDICWAKTLKEAEVDMKILNELPGKKILLEGNHDYWWDSQSKVTAAYPDMMFLKNNFYLYEDIAICGTRGWLCPNDTKFDDSDKKVYNRECVRLKLSLDAAVNRGYGDNILVMMHYPPMNDKHEPSGFTELFEKYTGVRKVIYGHIHGKESIAGRFEGVKNNIDYELVSADYLNFIPVKIL